MEAPGGGGLGGVWGENPLQGWEMGDVPVRSEPMGAVGSFIFGSGPREEEP